MCMSPNHWRRTVASAPPASDNGRAIPHQRHGTPNELKLRTIPSTAVVCWLLAMRAGRAAPRCRRPRAGTGRRPAGGGPRRQARMPTSTRPTELAHRARRRWPQAQAAMASRRERRWPAGWRCAAAADADLARARSREAVAPAELQQRAPEIERACSARLQLEARDEPRTCLRWPLLLAALPATGPPRHGRGRACNQRLAALEADPSSGAFAAYERLQAQQAWTRWPRRAAAARAARCTSPTAASRSPRSPRAPRRPGARSTGWSASAANCWWKPAAAMPRAPAPEAERLRIAGPDPGRGGRAPARAAAGRGRWHARMPRPR